MMRDMRAGTEVDVRRVSQSEGREISPVSLRLASVRRWNREDDAFAGGVAGHGVGGGFAEFEVFEQAAVAGFAAFVDPGLCL